jgi:SPP1 gp7 family putative phage head morphogenesis protein
MSAAQTYGSSALLDARMLNAPSPRFTARLGEKLAEYMAAADMLGRLHAMQVVKAKTGAVPKMNTSSAAQFHDAPKVLGFESVPIAGAADRIRNLTGMTKLAFDGLRQQYRRQAFTVAGLNDVGLIEKVKGALSDIIDSGGTLSDFQKAVNALTTDASVEDLAAFQLSTVFQTNVQRAYQNGHYAQMIDPDVVEALPYWKYMTAGDNRVRPNHAQLDGFVAQAKDPVWSRIYPPNGFNCRCTVVPILASEAPDDADVPGSQRAPSNVPDAGFAKGWVQ